jgi:hypothetical protein
MAILLVNSAIVGVVAHGHSTTVRLTKQSWLILAIRGFGGPE